MGGTRSLKRSALIIGVGFLLSPPQGLSQSSDSAAGGAAAEINVYCTNNRDGTGSCFETSNNTPYDCVAVQGTVVPCKSPAGVAYECQWVGHSDLVCSETASLGTQPITTNLFSGTDGNFPPLQSPPPDLNARPVTDSSEFAETFQPAGLSPTESQQLPPGDSQSDQVDTTLTPGSSFLDRFQAAPQ